MRRSLKSGFTAGLLACLVLTLCGCGQDDQWVEWIQRTEDGERLAVVHQDGVSHSLLETDGNFTVAADGTQLLVCEYSPDADQSQLLAVSPQGDQQLLWQTDGRMLGLQVVGQDVYYMQPADDQPNSCLLHRINRNTLEPETMGILCSVRQRSSIAVAGEYGYTWDSDGGQIVVTRICMQTLESQQTVHTPSAALAAVGIQEEVLGHSVFLDGDCIYLDIETFQGHHILWANWTEDAPVYHLMELPNALMLVHVEGGTLFYLLDSALHVYDVEQQTDWGIPAEDGLPELLPVYFAIHDGLALVDYGTMYEAYLFDLERTLCIECESGL